MRYRSIFTVTTPGDHALLDLPVAKDELAITDGTMDAKLTRWILQAGGVIEGPNGIARVLRADLVSESFRAGDCYYETMRAGLPLRRYPIITISSVIEDGTTLVVGTDYEVDAEAGLLYRLNGSSRIAWCAQVIQVSYQGGYAALTDVPADIQAAVLLLLQHRLAGQARGDPTLKALTIPGVVEKQWWFASSGEAFALPPEVAGLIAGYRDVHV